MVKVLDIVLVAGAGLAAYFLIAKAGEAVSGIPQALGSLPGAIAGIPAALGGAVIGGVTGFIQDLPLVSPPGIQIPGETPLVQLQKEIKGLPLGKPLGMPPTAGNPLDPLLLTPYSFPSQVPESSPFMQSLVKTVWETGVKAVSTPKVVSKYTPPVPYQPAPLPSVQDLQQMQWQVSTPVTVAATTKEIAYKPYKPFTGKITAAVGERPYVPYNP